MKMNTLNKKLTKFLVLIVSMIILIFAASLFFSYTNGESNKNTFNIKKDEQFENIIFPDITFSDFVEKGYNLGDSLNLRFSNWDK